MRKPTPLSAAALLAAALVILPFPRARAEGQGVEQAAPVGRDPSLLEPPHGAVTATIVAGPRYAAGGVRRWLLGNGHREIWLTPVIAPILDIGFIAGGLTPVEQGGGNQSITLHFEGHDGREYIFRSVDKHLDQGYPDDLKDTFLGEQIQDVISALFPAGAVAVAELLDYTGILHVDPVLYLMPDDPRLGEFRATFAGILGTLELTPDEGEEGDILFAGSLAIKSTDEFIEDLDSSPLHQLNTRRFLKARLFDLILNDTDRGGDQWRWARLAAGDGFLWEPIPRDRDWAFVDAGGFLVGLAASVYPKVVEFEAAYPSLTGLTIQAWELDRRLLADLDWNVWNEVIRELQNDLSDDAIASSLLAIPEPWRIRSGDRIGEVLRSRRDALSGFAREYYELLAFETDVHGTAEGENAQFDRLPAGDVRLRIFMDGADTPHFDRTYLEDDTREVRLYLEGGDDTAVVRGEEGPGAVALRIVGGEGDDVLTDEGTSTNWRVRTGFYDDVGDNRLEGGSSTEISEATYETPELDVSLVQQRLMSEPRDWGGGSSFGPHFEYGDAAGLVLGVTWVRERQGFRTQPYRYRGDATVMFATATANFGAEVGWSLRSTMRPTRLDLRVRGVQFESFRFFGYGNETARRERSQLDATLIQQDWVQADVTGILELGAVDIGVGPFFRYTDPSPPEGSPLQAARAVARGGVHVGLTAEAGSRAPTGLGLRFEARAEGLPSFLGDLEESLTSVQALGGVQVPIPLTDTPPTITVRAGGRHLWGEGFPTDESAFVGGRGSLRGYRFDRFAGRSAAYGMAELRIPLFELELLTRGRVGVLGFEDVGRVWWDDEDSAKWHQGYGGGIFYESLGFTVTGSLGHGEETRLYLSAGMLW